jgi:hypothetical protein
MDTKPNIASAFDKTTRHEPYKSPLRQMKQITDENLYLGRDLIGILYFGSSLFILGARGLL